MVIKRIPERAEDQNDSRAPKGIHRDGHYVFMFMRKGTAKMMVDFKTFKIDATSILCLLPGQVHQSFKTENISGWFIGANIDMIPDYVRIVFEELLVAIKPVSIDKDQSDKLNACAKLFHTTCSDELMATKEGLAIAQSLFHAYIGMFASIYTQEINREKTRESRAMQLTRQFRILVRQKYKAIKSPSIYAAELNISPTYLTEIVKDTTGESVSHWIQQEILMEAKRLLFFTDMTVKEIAYELGYEDHTYFSRLFSKLSTQSALAFRKKSRA